MYSINVNEKNWAKTERVRRKKSRERQKRKLDCKKKRKQKTFWNDKEELKDTNQLPEWRRERDRRAKCLSKCHWRRSVMKKISSNLIIAKTSSAGSLDVMTAMTNEIETWRPFTYIVELFKHWITHAKIKLQIVFKEKKLSLAKRRHRTVWT
jgi:hypothetical protein